MADTDIDRSKWRAFSLEEKVGFIVLCAVGAFGLLFSIYYLIDHLKEPFRSTYIGQKFETLSEQEVRQREEQKKKDTDKDGLSDYDEIYVYRTSQYLADSDSDGQDDGDEVNGGGNPNCPSGQECARDVDTGVTSPLTAGGLAGGTVADNGLTGEIKTEADIERYLNALTIDQIRQALVSSGVKEEDIAALSDGQVRELYDKALKQLKDSGGLQQIVNDKNQ
ncbi:MAG: hypothetical protein AAB886_00535 [Patescibacteria group bacterium]